MKKPIYSRTHPGKYILVLDTETSGSTFGTYEETFQKYQVLSVGAIVATSDTFEPVATLYFTIKFDASKYEWSDGAEKVHGLTREALERDGLTDEEAAATLAEFILTYFGTGKVMFLGHNPDFDIAGMDQLLEKHGLMPDLHHVVLDTSALGFITVGKFRSTELFNLMCGTRAEKHNALDDAHMTLQVAQNVKLIMTAGLEALGIVVPD
jgi:DNA polymerase III epsilon subunit-like protein